MSERDEAKAEILAIKRAFKQLYPLDSKARSRAMDFLMDILVINPPANNNDGAGKGDFE